MLEGVANGLPLAAMGDTDGNSIVALIIALIGLVIYFVPSIIASKRGHPNKAPIIALNLLLGWTFLGWVGALVWSLTAIQGSES